MQRSENVCPCKPIAKDKFQRLLASSWGRVWPSIGKGTMAQRMDLNSTKTIDRAVTGANLPEAHVVFNSLAACPTALDEVLGAYGYRAIPVTTAAANDLNTAAGTIDAMAALIRSQDDNHRDHNETLAIAQLLRPHMAALQGIMAEADRLRSAA